MALTEQIATLSDTMRTSQQLMLRIAESQAAIGPALQRLAEQRRNGGFDDAARAHLRNIELYLQRLLAEAEQGRAQSTAELRNDLRILTRTVAALADEHECSGDGAATPRRARRQRAERLARLRGRAVHAADGHHLRAAGVRAGAGVPVGRRCPGATSSSTG